MEDQENRNIKNISEKSKGPSNFIRNIIEEDLRTNKHNGRVITRFPPEPNGFLHIGHAKSIFLNFGIASENKKGVCHLRFDDTNPCKEDTKYVESIKQDINWLGFDWGDKLFHASDYFDKLYFYAIDLINKGKAYVCDLTAEQIKEYRGTLKEPGKESPFRNRAVEENLNLFTSMKEGKFKDGEKVLRAKIDMCSPNINMRDPIIYRIRHATHQRTGDLWCIYPMYDFTHCISDSLEGITHSLCSQEFEDHRPLYDWFLDELQVECHPRQIEFARLNLNYTLLSKRKLLELVEGNYVNGWNDPRMPTISGLRRRGYTPRSLKNFCDIVGVGKVDSWIDVGVLENSIRDDLNSNSPRVMAVLKPLKVIIENYPDNKFEELEAPNHPTNEKMGFRKITFSKEIYIEHDDFLEEPSKKFFRLSPGKEVRLKYAYIIKCEKIIKDAKSGEIIELRCSYDPATKGGNTPDGRKVKGTIHWVSINHSKNIKVRLYDRLFNSENPNGNDYKKHLNPNSLSEIDCCFIENEGLNTAKKESCQFERLGYFYYDKLDSTNERSVFNRTVTLKDTWAKISVS